MISTPAKKVFKEISEMDMDALIVGPTFNEETATLCKKMDAKEIPYVFVDSTIDNTSPIAFFTSDHYMIGCLMAKLITSIIPNNTNIGILQAVRTGDKSANSTIQRKKRVYRFSCKKTIASTIY